LAQRIVESKNAAVEAAVAPIDTRLQLPLCPALDVALPPANAAAMTAKVSCESPRWTIYVPVRLHAWVDAVVAATNLAPNRPLNAQDLTRGRVDLYSSNGGVLTNPAEVQGKILRVGVTVGSPILSPFLDLPITVHRGQKVIVTLVDRTMTIKTTALALEDGRVGDNIAVQNPDSQKTVHATVAADGNVEMRF
jgi:flagella basal body P-ring formation protein FlgA